VQAQPYPIFLKEDLFILQKKYLTFEEIQELMNRKVKGLDVSAEIYALKNVSGTQRFPY
jgi:hypothetical protein